MKKIFLMFGILIMSSSTVQAANIGNWSGSLRSWNQSEFTVVKGAMIDNGHTVESDCLITAADLADHDVFVIGEANSTPGSTELADLENWISGGGILLLLTDSGPSGVSHGNNILAGIGSGISISTDAPSVAPFPPGNCATEGPPYDIVGETLATSPGNSAVGGTAIAGDYIHYEPLGAGLVFVFGDRSDHNTFAPNGTTTNGQLFLNIAECTGKGGWGRAYNNLFDSTSDHLKMMRAYRDHVLSKTAKGKKYKDLLYNSSEEALGVLLDNPELMAQAKVLIEANIDAVLDVLDGYEGTIYNTDQIVAFLDAYASEAPPSLKALAKMIKRNMLGKQRGGKLFFGFRLR